MGPNPEAHYFITKVFYEGFADGYCIQSVCEGHVVAKAILGHVVEKPVHVSVGLAEHKARAKEPLAGIKRGDFAFGDKALQPELRRIHSESDRCEVCRGAGLHGQASGGRAMPRRASVLCNVRPERPCHRAARHTPFHGTPLQAVCLFRARRPTVFRQAAQGLCRGTAAASLRMQRIPDANKALRRLQHKDHPRRALHNRQGVADELTCYFASPAISSIDPDAETIGRSAAKILDDMLNGKSDCTPHVAVKPKGLVERGSTQTYPIDPPWLSDAMVFIRANVARRLTASDVFNHIGKSHSAVDDAFRRVLDTTVSSEIANSRIDEAERPERLPRNRAAIAGAPFSFCACKRKTAGGVLLSHVRETHYPRRWSP